MSLSGLARFKPRASCLESGPVLRHYNCFSSLLPAVNDSLLVVDGLLIYGYCRRLMVHRLQFMVHWLAHCSGSSMFYYSSTHYLDLQVILLSAPNWAGAGILPDFMVAFQKDGVRS